VTIRAENITKRFGDFTALDNVGVEVADGSLTALLGPSGSGKSTLLRIIAGLETPDSGRVLIGDEDVTGVVPQQRGIGFVFQHYAAFKHMTVRKNIAFGLEIRKRPKAEIRERVDELLGLVQLSGFGDRYPAQLSGGQRQRMALARALAIEPAVLLLDEPFGALDATVRKELRSWLRRLHEEQHVTTILVTHDQEEAMSMADRIAVLNRGNVEQCAPPVTIYDDPATLFVNQFVGTTNLLPVEVVGVEPDRVVVRMNGALLVARGVTDPALQAGAAALLSIRPEQLRFAAAGAQDRIAGVVRVALPMGPVTIYEVEAGAVRFKVTEAREGDAQTWGPGDEVHVEPADARAGRVFPTVAHAA
jgi:sulfate/thiosulfate transport system ATP-binding protein